MLTIDRERLVSEARLVGLGHDTPTLAAVDRRRVQVLVFAAVTLAGIAAAAVLKPTIATPFSMDAVRPMLGALAAGVMGYVADRERRLRRLTRMLVDERALSAALMLRLDEVRTMLDVAKAMNSTAALDTILGTIARAATSVVGGQSGSIQLIDGDQLHAIAAAGIAPPPGSVQALNDSPAAHVALTWEMVTTSATGSEPQTMYVPVRHGPELLGVLVLAAHHARPFGDYDVRAAELFAEQAACAISQTHRAQAARWQQEERATKDAARSELAIGAAAALKNPIASMMAATKMLQRPKLTDNERIELVTLVERQTAKLSKVVDDVLASQA